jgi:O-antigen/teichoic acid export membrane protein
MNETVVTSSGSGSGSGLSRVLGNLVHLLGGKAGAGLMSLVYLFIVARRLGAHDYGVLVLVSGYVTTMGSLIAFSGFHGVVRYGAIAREAGDPARLARLIRYQALIELGFGALAILVSAVAVPWIGPRLGWSPTAQALALPFSLGVIATVRATPQAVLQIAGRFDLIGLHQMVNPLIRLVGSLMLLVLGGRLGPFLIVWLVSMLAEGVMMWALAWPSWRRLTGEGLIGGWRHGEPGFGRFIVTANLDITLRELAPNLVPLTVGWILGPAAAGLLALAQRATNVLQQPAVLLAQASYSVLANLVARADFAGLGRTVWRSAALAVAIGLAITFVLVLLGSGLLTLIGGKSFAAGRLGAGLLVLVALSRALSLATAPLVSGLAALGRPDLLVAITTVTGLVFYPFLPLLLARFGLIGAGWHGLALALAAAAALAFYFRSTLRAMRSKGES